MKKLIVSSFFLLTFALSGVFAMEKALDIRPTAPVQALTSVQWENTNDVALAAATTDEALAQIVADPVAARGLLLKVRGAYETCPLAACQIAAVSQWVMQDDAWYCLWWDGARAAGRKVWVKALLERAEGTTDSYVKTFCLDQLRWCGCDCPCVLGRIRAIGAGSDKAVREFSEVVLRELQGQTIGR